MKDMEENWKKKAYSFCIHFDVGFRKLIISQM